MNRYLGFLISPVYADSGLHPEHLADLRKSGLTSDTIALQKIQTIPPSMIDQLLGFPMPKIQSAYLIPFPDPRGGWLDHVRMKVFPALTTGSGTTKYLQPRRSGVRIFFPLATLDAVVHSAAAPLFICEGEKKSLSLGQLGLSTVGICGIEGWHIAGTSALHPDLDVVPLRHRIVELVPDGDWRTNPNVNRGVNGLGEALERRGASVRVILLPEVAR